MNGSHRWCTVTRIKKGFTLIELLVVVAITSLLASIILANLNQLRNKARIAAGNTLDAQFYHTMANEAYVLWDFNESSGDAVDFSGNNYSGSFVGSVARSSDTKSGSGSSILFNGLSGAYVQSPLISPAIPFPNGITISAWVKLSNGTNDHAIALVEGSSGALISLSVTGSTLKVEEETSNNFYSLPSVDSGNWMHIAYAYKNSGPQKCAMYVNGREVPITGGTCGFSPGSINRFYAGRSEDQETRVGSRIDDVRIYADTLLAQDIRDLYLARAASYSSLSLKYRPLR
ncbi:MAG TPA: LamG-like jellyroll fold domain-containing protein [Candidatus Paceibacterota bacterium]